MTFLIAWYLAEHLHHLGQGYIQLEFFGQCIPQFTPLALIGVCG